MTTNSLINTYELTFEPQADFDKIEKLFETSILDDTFDYVEYVPAMEVYDTPNDPKTSGMRYIPTVEADKAWQAGADNHNGK